MKFLQLGFPESLGNVEGSKKRSLDVRTMGGNAIQNEFIVSLEKVPKTQFKSHIIFRVDKLRKIINLHPDDSRRKFLLKLLTQLRKVSPRKNRS